jgi:hypothetical protein
MPTINIKSWHRFITKEFCVESCLMGKSHTFSFENYEVKVKLPGADKADRNIKSDEVARVGTRISSTNEVLNFYVLQVDLEIAIPEAIAVPDGVLDRPPNAFELFSDAEKNKLESIAKQQSGVSERAFKYWLEIIRWSSENSYIGQDSVSGAQSGWGTYLADVKSGHRVWAGSHTFFASFVREVTRAQWQLAQDRLNEAAQVPLHISFLCSAEQSCAAGYFQSSVIEVAMACEIYLRHSVVNYFSDNPGKSISRHIKKEKISRYINNFFGAIVLEQDKQVYQNLKSEIISLMSMRNTFLHEGEMDEANKENSRRFSAVAKKLFAVRLIGKSNSKGADLTVCSRSAGSGAEGVCVHGESSTG